MSPAVHAVITQSAGRHNKKLYARPPRATTISATAVEPNTNLLNASFGRQNVISARKRAISQKSALPKLEIIRILVGLTK